jgi:glycosyl transferase family 25
MLDRPKIPTIIINLERDTARRARISVQIEKFQNFKPSFIPAVHGLTLPDSACLLLSDSHSWVAYKGAIGCFLSHVMAWEHTARLDAPFALILEDDADMLNLDALHAKTLPEDFDVIFVNHRMSPKTKPPTGDFISMGESLAEIDLKREGFGTDGYLLTPQAAKTLLAACQEDRYYGHVDGRLVRYASTEADLVRAGTESAVASVIRQHHNPRRLPKLGLLKGYVLCEPLVRHAGLVSSRDAMDKPAAG